MAVSFECTICGRPELEEIKEYRSLPRVTSDCKPFPPGGRLYACLSCGAIQKTADREWLSDIDKVYSDYEIYKLSDGGDQLIFTDSGPAPRSQRLVEFLISSVALAREGRLIDIGCGNGAALSRFSDALPAWKLYGCELSDRERGHLEEISNFEELYTVPLAEVRGRFDVVSLIHSLEHMKSPRETLEQAKRLLAHEGVLFVEVPDVETSPFDLLVVDHLMHFSRATLGYLAALAGVSTFLVSNTVLPKEITMIGRLGAADMALPAGTHVMKATRETVTWLTQVLEFSRKVAGSSPIGIFGTSISGMWLFGPLKESVSFFVDEDPSRIGRHFAGRPILSPLDAPSGATVLVPLLPAIAVQIAERYIGAPARFVPIPGHAG